MEVILCVVPSIQMLASPCAQAQQRVYTNKFALLLYNIGIGRCSGIAQYCIASTILQALT